MYDKFISAVPHESLAHIEPTPSLMEADRALQLYEEQTGYGQWKLVFPGSVWMSDQLSLTLGLTPSDEPVPLQDMVKLYVAEDRGKLLAMIAQSLEGRRGFKCRLRIDRRDGHIRMIETIADLRIRDGKVVGLFGASRDVTAEVERELATAGRLQLVQDMVSDMPAPVVIVDEHLRVMDCSLFWLKAHRFVERREVVGKTLHQLFPEAPHDQAKEYEAALKGQTVKTKRPYAVQASSTPVLFNTVISPWYAGDKKVGGIMIAVGWSEIAVAKATQPPKEEAESFDGSLLDMLKAVT
ncbi:PAS domain-containing protein [Devosia sp.]|uniref:PAS domain-containing protein n=1 Tax=Devosia sp. TaxID=1871048 RepID=UPI003BA96DF9